MTVAPFRILILGRPNVGKSSLFNRIVGKRQSLVRNQPGVTRDLITQTVELWGYTIEVIDSPGVTSESELAELLESQHLRFQLVLWVLDGRSGFNPFDQVVWRFLEAKQINYLALINKIDRWDQKDELMSEFWPLASDRVLPISVEHKLGMDLFWSWLLKQLAENHLEMETEEKPAQWPKLLILGRPNVGKSSLFNQLIGSYRSQVDSQAHTTRDLVVTPLEWDQQTWLLMDSAGISRKRPSNPISQVAQIKTWQAIDEADFVILVVDVHEGLSHKDAQLLAEVIEKPKTVVVAANKWDLASHEQKKSFPQQVSEVFRFFPDVPWVPISAKTGWNLNQLTTSIRELWQKAQKRFPTSAVNEFFQNLIQTHTHLSMDHQPLKIYYVTQTRKVPPVFLMFVNQEQAVTKPLKRFLVHQLKTHFQFQGLPVTLVPLASR